MQGTAAFVELNHHGNRPSMADLVERARSFEPMLRERAAETEANRRVSGEVMDQLGDADLLSLVKPAQFGGLQYPPSALLHIGYELGRACGSTGWCAMLANCNNWFAAYWSLSAQEELWRDPRHLACGTVAPTGKCDAVEGGYRIWGKWPWASNCDNSQWAFVSAVLPSGDGAPVGVGWFMTPMSTLTIDQSSWFVSGMQGTGSKTLVANEPIFVPAHRALRFGDIINRATPGCAVPGNPMANFAFTTFGAVPLVSPVIGMAQGALEIYVQTMRDKVRVAMRPGAPATAAENPFVQERVGRASARIAAARAVLLAELTAVEDRVFHGYQPDTGERLSIRRAVGFAARECTDAVNSLMEIAGASAADSSAPLQRVWRDINAASRHLAFDPTSIYPLVGQHLFGMQPVGNF